VNIAPRSRARGYTAVELLTTLSVVGIVTALAVPNFQQFMQNNRAAADANALIGALNIARNEAVSRGLPVSVCASADGATCSGDETWSTGWIVFTDAVPPVGDVDDAADPDTVLQVFPALTGGSALAADATFVGYRPNGFLANAAAPTFDLTVAYCTGDNNRRITLNLQGRAGVTHETCPDAED
jgi:type IV fimbrial biogenesis protein FimT